MRSLTPALILALSACASPANSEEIQLPEGARVIPLEFGEMALRQCSRASPEGSEPFWHPTSSQVTVLERNLSEVLRDSQSENQAFIAAERAQFGEDARIAFDFANDPTAWSREYIGYTHDGRRYIYGNIAPEQAEDRRRLGHPMIICDGGPVFFGVEYDVESARVSRVAFNGAIGGPFLSPIIVE